MKLTRFFATTIFVAAAMCALAPRAESASEPFAHLSRQEVPGRQIGWIQNQTLEAFTEAVEANKPLVIVFGDRTSRFFVKQAEVALPCPHVNQLVGHAVFAIGMPDTDEYARRMALRLKLATYPTISVIAPRTDKLVELHRMEGFFDAEAIATDLRKVIWPKGLPDPPKLPSNSFAYPNMACTAEGARRLGIGLKETPRSAPSVAPLPPPPDKRAQPAPKPYGETPKP
jgi:hypothetical protein